MVQVRQQGEKVEQLVKDGEALISGETSAIIIIIIIIIALCKSCNGEVPMINFQFLRKNVTFTFLFNEFLLCRLSKNCRTMLKFDYFRLKTRVLGTWGCCQKRCIF